MRLQAAPISLLPPLRETWPRTATVRIVPFTAALLKFIETPGLEVRQMMSRVRGDVEEETDGKQIPWDSSSLLGDFYFDPKTTGERVIREINGPNPQVDLDALFWELVKNSKNPKDFSAYLLEIPARRVRRDRA